MSKIDEKENIVTKLVERDDLDVNHNSVVRRGSRCRVRTIVRGQSLTKQADRDRANIHNIIARFEKTGMIPQRVAQPLEGNIPHLDFMQAQNLVVGVHQWFDGLPVQTRKRFSYSPSELLRFAADPDNAAELVRLGLSKAVEAINEQTRTPVPASPEAAPTEQAQGGAGASAGGQ